MPNNIAEKALKKIAAWDFGPSTDGLYGERDEAKRLAGDALRALAHEAERGDAEGLPEFDDPAVRVVYNILCDDVAPPPEEHWEGWCARKIVAALKAREQPARDERRERADFERWYSDDGLSPRAVERTGPLGGYRLMQTQSAWVSWFARAAFSAPLAPEQAASDARERFEAWATARGYRNFTVNRGTYLNEELYMLWLAWQASAAIAAKDQP